MIFKYDVIQMTPIKWNLVLKPSYPYGFPCKVASGYIWIIWRVICGREEIKVEFWTFFHFGDFPEFDFYGKIATEISRKFTAPAGLNHWTRKKGLNVTTNHAVHGCNYWVSQIIHGIRQPFYSVKIYPDMTNVHYGFSMCDDLDLITARALGDPASWG